MLPVLADLITLQQYAPFFVAASLSGLLGTGLVNLFNSTSSSKWIVWGIQWAVALVMGLLLLPPAVNPVAADTGTLPSPTALSRLLTKTLLEDMHRTMEHGNDTCMGGTQKEANGQGATQGETGPEVNLAEVAAVELRGFIDETEKDAHRFKRVYLGSLEGTKLDDVLKLCEEARTRVADPLDKLIQTKNTLDTDDYSDLMQVINKLSEAFLIEHPKS